MCWPGSRPSWRPPPVVEASCSEQLALVWEFSAFTSFEVQLKTTSSCWGQLLRAARNLPSYLSVRIQCVDQLWGPAEDVIQLLEPAVQSSLKPPFLPWWPTMRSSWRRPPAVGASCSEQLETSLLTLVCEFSVLTSFEVQLKTSSSCWSQLLRAARLPSSPKITKIMPFRTN